jgi:hypothetical protein
VAVFLVGAFVKIVDSASSKDSTVICTAGNSDELRFSPCNCTLGVREQPREVSAARVHLRRLHQIRSPACGASALACIQSTYTFVFFIDSQNRKSKTIIVL